MTVRVCGAVSTVCGRTSTRASCNTKKSSVAEQWRPVVGYEGLSLSATSAMLRVWSGPCGVGCLRCGCVSASWRPHAGKALTSGKSRCPVRGRHAYYVHLLAREAFSDDSPTPI